LRVWLPAARVRVAVIMLVLGLGIAHHPNWGTWAPGSAGVAAAVVVPDGIGNLVILVFFWRCRIEVASLGYLAANGVLHILSPGLFLEADEWPVP
jgi:hypothetical protein